MYSKFALKAKINLQLNHCRFPDDALSIKTRLCLRFIVYEEKVNCQLDHGHPFSTVTVYLAKL